MRYHKNNPEQLDDDYQLAEALKSVQMQNKNKTLKIRTCAKAFTNLTHKKSPEQLGEEGLKRAEKLFNAMIENATT